MAEDLLSALDVAFEAKRNPVRAVAMRAYMRDQFEYYGIPAPAQRAIQRDVLAKHPPPTHEDALKDLVLACWSRPEREWQYFGCSLCARGARAASPRFLTTVRKVITTKSWWDTIDNLASHTTGTLVRRHPSLVRTMDRWIEHPNIWLVRTAILYQLSYGKDTDAVRLFDYCLRRSTDTEFFIRKAIGWSLRQYSKTDERAVRTFVHEHGEELSGLSKREALKWLDRRR